jgi:hypothetical protein
MIGDEHEKCKADIETKLKANKSYLMIGAELASDALKYIYRIDNLTDRLVSPARDGIDWRTTEYLTIMLFDDMEEDLCQIVSALKKVVPEVPLSSLGWDYDCEEHYYFDHAARIYKYNIGMWLRPDGSKTSPEQELGLIRAYNPSAQPSLTYQNTVYPNTDLLR